MELGLLDTQNLYLNILERCLFGVYIALFLTLHTQQFLFYFIFWVSEGLMFTFGRWSHQFYRCLF